MRTLSAHIRSVMIVSGLLTCTMLYAALFPDAAMRSTFGETASSPLAEMVIRNWGVLVFLMGVLLIKGALDPRVRATALIAAGTSKLAFIGLVLSSGSEYLSRGAALPVFVDSVVVAVFAAYLASQRRRGTLEA